MAGAHRPRADEHAPGIQHLRGDGPRGLRRASGGDDRARLEALSQEWGLQRGVCFLGSLSDAELEGELRHCSVMVMPSAYGIQSDGRACGEGFGIVYLEAAQAWRASIACQQGGQSDLIVDGDNGWLIDPNPADLAQLILQLANHPERLAKAGRRAHQRALDAFSRRSFDQALTRACSTPLTA